MAVKVWRDFQIPEDLQKNYGSPAITEEDRRKIFGLNLARLLGIDTKGGSKCYRAPPDKFYMHNTEKEENHETKD